MLVIEFISARYDGGEVGTISLAGYPGAIPEVSTYSFRLYYLLWWILARVAPDVGGSIPS